MKNSNLKQSIGIIGGMGPQASAKLLEVLITMCNRDYGAENDSDFPEIILNSVPVPDFISNKRNINTAFNILETFKILEERIKNLEKFNPACFGIACNTIHLLLKDLQTKTKVPFVSIIEKVADEVYLSKIEKVGLLATPVTLASGLYQKALAEQNIKVVIPSKNEQEIIEKVIRNILGGNIDSSDRNNLVLVAKSFKRKGVEGIILGCTELPLIFPKNFPVPVFDSIEILARALLKKYFEKIGGDKNVQ